MHPNALTVIHKLIRHELFAVAHRLATAGEDDDAAVRDAIHAMAGLLRGHAEQEDDRLMPELEAVAPELARRLEADHDRLESELDAICAAADALLRIPDTRRPTARQRLHDDWNRFVAVCLLHMDDEERAMEPLLGERVALSKVAEAAMTMEQVTADEFLAHLWRAITPQERIAIERARLRLQLARAAAKAGGRPVEADAGPE